MATATTTVRDWYKEKNLFITGASGFLGVCLLEKLLRTIPDIGTIYILLRPKRGKKIEERLDEIKKNSVFEKLYETKSAEEVCLFFFLLVVWVVMVVVDFS